MKFQFKQFDNREQQAEAAANWLAGRVKLSPLNDLPTRLTLSGGSTPIPVYEKLAKIKLDWTNIEILPNDERCVPDDHPRNNLSMLKQTLGADKNYIPLVEGEAAGEMDIALIGAGADGHFASLFPDTVLDKESKTIQKVHPASQPESRLTLPFFAFQWVSQLLLLISGKDKLQMLLDTPLNSQLNTTASQPMTLEQLQKMQTLQEFKDNDIHFGKTSLIPLSHLFAARLEAKSTNIKETLIYYAD